MRPETHRSSQEWYQEASRSYLEGHQACAWCGGSHRVFKTHRGSRLEYHCNDCNFYVCYDQASNSYRAEPGLETSQLADHQEQASAVGNPQCFGLG